MTRGRAATPDPFDIGAVSRSGEVFETLAARRPADPGDDPAVRLLAALVADVDRGAPPLPTPARLARPKSRRRTVRVVVTLGVTAAVLTTAGAAAAGGGGHGRDATGARAPHVKTTEHTVGHLHVTPSERPSVSQDPNVLPEERAEQKRRDDSDRRWRSPRSGRPRNHPAKNDRDLDQPTAPAFQGDDDDQGETPTPQPDVTTSVPALRP